MQTISEAAPVLCNHLFPVLLAILFLTTTQPLYGQGSTTWEPTNGPAQQATSITKTKDGGLFCSFGGRTARSEDGGSTWKIVDSSFYPLHALVCDSLGTLIGTSVGGGGLPGPQGTNFRSTDNGITWNGIRISEIGFPVVTGYIVDPDNRIMAATEYGFFESSDDGLTWTADTINNIPEDVTGLALTPQGAVLAATDWPLGLYRRDAPDASWIRVDSLNLFEGLILNPEGYLFSATYEGIVRSSDLGYTWELVNQDLNDYTISTIACADDSVILVSTPGGIVRSSDLGETWQGTGTESYNTGFVQVIDSMRLLASCTVGLLRSTDNGLTWRLDNGAGVPLVGFSFVERGDNGWVYAGNGGSIFGSPDEGMTWRVLHTVFYDPENFYPPIVDAIASTPTGGMLFAERFNGIYTTFDHGLTWISITQALLWQPAALCMDWRGDILAAEYGGTLYLRRNGTSTWDTILRLEDSASATGLRSLAVDSSGTYYAGYEGGLKISEDGGQTWKDAVPLIGLNVGSLAVDRGGRVFAGTEQDGIFVSANRGTDWTPITGGLNSPTISAIEPLRYGETICATAAGGVFRLDLDGVQWEPIGEGLPQVRVLSLASDERGRAYAATSRGLFRSVSPVSSIAEPSSEQPSVVQLFQNYPNPFNPLTTIRYSLPSRSPVTLTVFNTLGQHVATLVQVEQGVGYFEAVFDASGLASGVYLYRLQAGKTVQTRSMICIR